MMLRDVMLRDVMLRYMVLRVLAPLHHVTPSHVTL